MLYQRYPALTACRADIEAAERALIDCFAQGSKLLICGNGGSCADGDHIVGELMKGFLLARPVGDDFAAQLRETGIDGADAIAARLQGALPAISLASQTALLTALGNDIDAEMAYAQMVYGYGRPGDALLCLSTSGNARNAVLAASVARARGLVTIAMTGSAESKLSRLCDITIRAPERETFRVQELHLPIYHHLCMRLEAHFFGRE